VATKMLRHHPLQRVVAGLRPIPNNQHLPAAITILLLRGARQWRGHLVVGILRHQLAVKPVHEPGLLPAPSLRTVENAAHTLSVGVVEVVMVLATLYCLRHPVLAVVVMIPHAIVALITLGVV